MALVTNYIFVDILLAIFPFLYLAYCYVTHNDDYWDKRGVPYVKGKSDLFKNLIGVQSQHEMVSDLYNKFPGTKYIGTFQINKPMLVVRDPELIQKILIKDFIHFQDRGGFNAPANEPLAKNLFALKGQQWKALRYKLTPTFTTGKLRMMWEQISKCGDNLVEKLRKISCEGNEFECKDFMHDFTLDVISSCAFGIQFQPNSIEFNTFKTKASKIFDSSFTSILRSIVVIILPRLAKLLNLSIFSKDSTNYLLNFTKEAIKHRRETGVKRNDYLQLLLTLKEQEDSGKEIVSTSSDTTEDDAVIDQMHYIEGNGQSKEVHTKLMTEDTICANSTIFLIAGSDSTAITVSFTLLSLSQHPGVQHRLQREVDSVLKHHGGWNYDAIKELTYMDQVVQETQRMYPLLPTLFRECIIPYKVPGSDLVIEKGVLISIPVAGLHKDPQYYPEPHLFNPDRFEGNNFKPNPAFLPFGDGPRVCIAMRFAVMEVKTCLARIMSQYTVSLNPKTKMPLQFMKRKLFPEVDGGIWLNFENRKLST